MSEKDPTFEKMSPEEFESTMENAVLAWQEKNGSEALSCESDRQALAREGILRIAFYYEANDLESGTISSEHVFTTVYNIKNSTFQLNTPAFIERIPNLNALTTMIENWKAPDQRDKPKPH